MMPSTILLIDTEDRYLVNAPKNVSYTYIALSYVWGKVADPLYTTLGNVGIFRCKGAFDLSHYRERLPRTIRDSMSLTQLLGKRHLWVNRFYIVQDDIGHIHKQLKAIAFVYTNTYFIIVAFDSSGDDYGIRGVGKGSKPRQYKLDEFKFVSDYHLIVYWSYDLARREYLYPMREWIFQEREVSQR